MSDEFENLRNRVRQQEDQKIVLLNEKDKIMLELKDLQERYNRDISNNYIITKIKDITSNLIKTDIETLAGSKVFIYGKEVDDFHLLDKSYIYTLNVCAVQDLYRIIENQQILTVEPKTYNYIDQHERGTDLVYGFMAQQIEKVIPHAVARPDPAAWPVSGNDPDRIQHR